MIVNSHAIYRVGILKQNIQIRIMGLEELWKRSAIGREALDSKNMVNLARQIREETNMILQICKESGSNAESAAWNPQ